MKKLSESEVKELEQLYDVVQLELERNPTLTMAELEGLYPVEQLHAALRYAPLFGAEDSVNHHFIRDNNDLYVAQEYANLVNHSQIMQSFVEFQYHQQDNCFRTEFDEVREEELDYD